VKLARLVACFLLAACVAATAGRPQPGPRYARFSPTGAEADAPAEEEPLCVPYTRALEKLGEVACITGKVVDVHTARTGVTYVNFCRDYRDCKFSIVVLAADARRLRDVRVLLGKEIRITGKVTSYRGRTEILWRKPEQLQVAVDEPGKKK